MGWSSPMIPYFLSANTHIEMTRFEAEWMETALLLGAVCGLPITAFFVDNVGRKRSLLFSCSVLVMTWAVVAASTEIWYLYSSRFVQGLGLNMAFVAAPMYVGEISHKSIRGTLSSLIYALSVFGVVVIYSIGTLCAFYIPSIIAISILTFEIIVFSFMPESPYYLVSKGRYEEGEAALKKFRRVSNVDFELNQIKHAVQNDKEEKWRLWDILKYKNYRRALLIMVILNSGQLFCSFEVILMNLHEILASAGSIYLSASIASIIFSCVNLFASIISCLVVDKFGRKVLLIISTVLTGFCLFFIAFYFHMLELGFNMDQYSWLPIVAVMIYAAVFKFGLGTVPIVVTSEVFASKIKAFGMTFVDGVYVVSSILSLQLFFFMRDTFGMHVPFYTFFGCSIVTLLCIIYYVPETKGKSLEEIQEILKK